MIYLGFKIYEMNYLNNNKYCKMQITVNTYFLIFPIVYCYYSHTFTFAYIILKKKKIKIRKIGKILKTCFIFFIRLFIDK